MRLAILIAMAATATGLRSVVLVRHGISEMNVALARRPWGSPGFADPDIRDAPLTPEGLAASGTAPRRKTWALSQWPRRPSCTVRHGCEDGQCVRPSLTETAP